MNTNRHFGYHATIRISELNQRETATWLFKMYLKEYGGTSETAEFFVSQPTNDIWVEPDPLIREINKALASMGYAPLGSVTFTMK